MWNNSNNFLRWTGVSNKLPYGFSMVNLEKNFYANQDYIVFDPLELSSCIIGFNTESLEVTNAIDEDSNPLDLSKPNYWDGVSKFTFYRPVDFLMSYCYFFFRVKDSSGNPSPVFFCKINFEAVEVSWVEDPGSAGCILNNFGENNGYMKWEQLKLVNSITLSDIIPIQTKPNLIGDPDYIPPALNLISCPTPTGGDYAPLIISNFSNNPANIPEAFITITQIVLACSACGAGGTPQIFVVDCNIPPGSSKRINVPAITWDTGITFQYSVTGDMVGVANPVLWRSNVNGFVDNYPTGATHQVDNTGIYGNFSLTVPSPNGITIFCK